jgi:2-polyprenyl-3-methyl-5-hydroxy-6-metoxy-1,4-benzoquinol methylase
LGCGIGANSIPLLKKNWKVTAIDLFEDSLHNLHKKAAKLSARVNLIRGDIKTLPFEKNEYDLILAVDVLPYTPAIDLVAMMKKIYEALKPNGIFIGTFFFLPTSNKFSKHITLMNSVGVEFLKDPTLPREILKNAGFEILKINFRLEFDSEPVAIEATAKKI